MRASATAEKSSSRGTCHESPQNLSTDLFSIRRDNELRAWNLPKTQILKTARGKIV